MPASGDSGLGDEVPLTMRAGGAEPKRKRARPAGVVAGGGGSPSGGAGVHMEKGSSAPAAAPAPAPASRIRAEGAAASVEDVTVEDADALDCGVCSLPLKAPIFQCDVGHAVCSPCHDKLKVTGECHACGVATGSYRRCRAMERLVESIRVPCPHAAHGCTARPAYHSSEAHAPCHCPGEACGFVAAGKLLEHLGTAHGWPCTTVAMDDNGFDIGLRDGFNFVLAGCTTTNRDEEGSAGSAQCLLLLNVARQPLGRVISVLWIVPHAAAAAEPVSKEMECELSYSRYTSLSGHRGGNPLICHYQISTFSVACTDLSNGLPSPDGCFHFVVPDSAVGEDDEKGDMLLGTSAHIVVNYL